MKVAIVVLAWNSLDLISPCLDSIAQLSRTKTDIEVIVVDNNSSDNTSSLMAQKYPWCTYIANDKNLGCAQGNNIGIVKALENKADYVWLINPDITVHPAALEPLLASADKYKDAALFSPKIYYSPSSGTERSVWYAGGNMDWVNVIGKHRGRDEVDNGQFDHAVETDFITGSSMFIRSRVLHTVGLLDTRYYLFYEDLDYCQRTKKAGWRLMFIPESICWHSRDKSPQFPASLKDYFITRNRLLFGLRYAPARTKLSLALESLNFYLSGRPWQRRAVLDYYTHNLGQGSYEIN